MPFESVHKAIAEFRAGRMVILVDDEDRENEGDLCVAAEKVTPEAVNFMARYGRGLICLALTEERIQHLQLPMMVAENTSHFGTGFTVSIEARRGVTTGISAADRATTILTAVDPKTGPQDLARPGHIFPLRAMNGGVLVRTGQTEGVVDLARLSNLSPAGVICEIMNDDGSMARMADLEKFSQAHGIPIVSIADVIEYRLAHESLVRRLVEREVMHPQWGKVTVYSYGTTLDTRQHLVLVKGDITGETAPLVRVHAGYPLSHVLGDVFSDERDILRAALGMMGKEERGVLVCIDQGKPALPLDQRIMQLGKTPQAEQKGGGILREIGVGAQILRDLGLSRIRLLSNSPRRLAGLDGYGLHVEEVLPMVVQTNVAPVSLLEVVGGGRS